MNSLTLHKICGLVPYPSRLTAILGIAQAQTGISSIRGQVVDPQASLSRIEFGQRLKSLIQFHEFAVALRGDDYGFVKVRNEVEGLRARGKRGYRKNGATHACRERCCNLDRGSLTALPSHTTVYAGPHTAVP
jgi:hypothetical protein